MTTLGGGLSRVEINHGFARAVVEGLADGLVWRSPSMGAAAVHVLHSYGMSLIWGDRVDAAFDELVDRLLTGDYRSVDEWLQIDPRWAHLPWRARLLGEWSAVQLDRRLNFGFDIEQFRTQRRQLPSLDGWSLSRATAADYARAGSVVPSRFWRSADDFLAHGGGWRVERDGVVGALAFTSFRFDDRLELGIETAPEYRRCGLGAHAAAHMIDELLAAGVTPEWACRGSNTGSARLAARLGFVPTREVDYFRLPAGRLDELAK